MESNEEAENVMIKERLTRSFLDYGAMTSLWTTKKISRQRKL